MSERNANVVICGAGIAGVSLAYQLAVHHGVEGVVLVDQGAPLSLTSDKSNESYRNWWPGPDGAMVQLMNRSIDILEDLADLSGNVFHLNRRGYLYGTADAERIPEWLEAAKQAEAFGGGALRIHGGNGDDPEYIPHSGSGYRGQPTGADLITHKPLIRANFPFLHPDTVAVLHVRRAGWFSGQQLGMHMLEAARKHGVQVIKARVEGVELAGGAGSATVAVEAVNILGEGGTERISTPCFVNAAGPMLKEVGQMLGLDLPVFSERHLKASFKDAQGAIPRGAPLLIWEDPQRLPWSAEEAAELEGDADVQWLLESLPAGVHVRPEGGLEGQNILVLWAYDTAPEAEVFPLPESPYFPEVALRGMAAAVPALQGYFERIPRPYVDGGYYTKTVENRLLCGPLPVPGAYVLGALSGFGLMTACAVGELCALHITGGDLPSYAKAFLPTRYEDAAYQELLKNWDFAGQL